MTRWVKKVKKKNSDNNSYDSILDRNKICVLIDLKSRQGLHQACKLIDKSDIVIENFRPGVMEKIGLDFNKLIKYKPSIIFLSLPGFSKKDITLKNVKATE